MVKAPSANEGEENVTMIDTRKVGQLEMEVDDEPERQDTAISHERQQITHPRVVDSHGQNNHNNHTEEKEDETQAPPSSSPTLVDSSSPPDMDVQLSVKLDDILNKYPSTRVFMSEVRNLRFLPSFPCASCRPCLNSPSFPVSPIGYH